MTVDELAIFRQMEAERDTLRAKNCALRNALIVARQWMPTTPSYTKYGQADIDLVDEVIANSGS